MKPYQEYIVSPPDSSWVLFDRRLEHIPFEWHYNTEYELTLTLNSRGQRFIGDSISPYDDGDLVLIAPKIPHTWYSSSRPDEGRPHQAIVLWFSEKFVHGMIGPHVELSPIQRLLDASSRGLAFSPMTRRAARGSIEAMLDQSPPARLLSLLNLLLLLATDAHATGLTAELGEMPSSPAASEERIGRVLAHLHANYRSQIPVAKLMRSAALSRSSLHRLFKQQTSLTIGGYLAQLRVGHASALLMNTKKPIAVIADEVGYRNLANFNRQFKALKRQTPKAFRSAFHG